MQMMAIEKRVTTEGQNQECSILARSCSRRAPVFVRTLTSSRVYDSHVRTAYEQSAAPTDFAKGIKCIDSLNRNAT